MIEELNNKISHSEKVARILDKESLQYKKEIENQIDLHKQLNRVWDFPQIS